jgi:tRNA-specific 2-thiouridylase
VGAQVRAHGEEIPARAWAHGEQVEVRLERRIRGVAPGQSVVLYDGTRVVGSATITKATSRAQTKRPAAGRDPAAG